MGARRGADPARLVIQSWQALMGKFVKSLRFHGKSKVGVIKSPRNRVLTQIREMSKEEFFHKMYVIGKVGRVFIGPNVFENVPAILKIGWRMGDLELLGRREATERCAVLAGSLRLN